MSQNAELLAELKKLTKEIEILIASSGSDIEPILELADRRLALLARLQDIMRTAPDDAQLIRDSAKELLSGEQAMILQVQDQKEIVAGLLNQVLSGNKARELYGHVSKDK